MPTLLFVICLLGGAAGIAIALLARLLRSYPLAFFGMIVTLAAGALAFVEGRILLGIYWILFSILSVIFAVIWLYKNKRWAFWWSFGADVGLILAAVSASRTDALDNLEGKGLINAALPIIVFLVVGILFNIIFNVIIPKARHMNKNERKHLTNTDPLIGQRVTISKDKEDGHSQRGYIGDVDWSIEPLYGYETFKVGDVVKIVTIKGVTLMCTRDGKDYRAEIRAKHKEEMAKQRIEDEKLRAKRKAIKASRELEAEKRRLLREEEKAKRAAELRRVKQEQEEAAAKQKAELEKVREQRRAAEEARKLEEKKAVLAKKAKKREEEAAKKAEAEALKAKKAEEEAAKKAAERAEKEVVKETKPEPVAVQPAKPKKEKPAKVKKEKAPKEKKPSKFFKKDKYTLVYIISSILIVLISAAFLFIALRKMFHDSIRIIQVVFLGLVIAYFVLIIVLETLRVRARKAQEKPVEEAKVEEVVEEVKVEEVVEEPKKEKAEFVPFATRLEGADDFLRQAYNELKSEILSYGIKSRVSSTGDKFRLHTKTYVKMVIAGKYLKLYFALNPNDYKDTTYPYEDASRMEIHKDTPFVFKIKSGLSVRRAKVLIADCAKKDDLVQGEVVMHDHASDIKVEEDE